MSALFRRDSARCSAGGSPGAVGRSRPLPLSQQLLFCNNSQQVHTGAANHVSCLGGSSTSASSSTINGSSTDRTPTKHNCLIIVSPPSRVPHQCICTWPAVHVQWARLARMAPRRTPAKRGRASSKQSVAAPQQSPAPLLVLIGFYVLLVGYALHVCYWTPQPKPADVPASEFSEAR